MFEDLSFECEMRCAQIKLEAEMIVKNMINKCQMDIQAIPESIRKMTTRELAGGKDADQVNDKENVAEEEQIVVVGAAAGKKTRRKGKATGLQIVDQNQRSTRSKAVKGKKEKVVVVEEEDENEEEEELQKPQVENSVMKGKLDEAIMAAASANSRYRTRRAVKLAAESNIALVKNNIPAESTNRRPKRTARA